MKLTAYFKMKIFLTGASGFVGKNLMDFLIQQGHDVIGHVRSNSEAIPDFGRKFSHVNLLNHQEILYELSGVDTVIHCAALVNTWSSSETFYQNNVSVTQTLLESAKLAGVQRLIFLSCASVVMQQGQDLMNIPESLPLTNRPELPYIKSKALAEALVLEAATENFKTIALRPAFIWGKGDIIDRQIGQAALNGKFGWFNQGHYLYSTCYIDNLYEAISKALTTDLFGESFFITDGEPISFRSFMSQRLQISGFPIPTLSIPRYIAWALGRFTENGWKYLPFQGLPPITREIVRLTGFSFTLCIEKSKQQLDYQPAYSVPQGLKHLASQLEIKNIKIEDSDTLRRH
jgi:nucleoside-diphosphate-sugar epimerase